MNIKEKVMETVNKNKSMMVDLTKAVGASIALSVACTYGTKMICAGIDKVVDRIKSKQQKGETLEEFFDKETEEDA